MWNKLSWQQTAVLIAAMFSLTYAMVAFSNGPPRYRYEKLANHAGHQFLYQLDTTTGVATLVTHAGNGLETVSN